MINEKRVLDSFFTCAGIDSETGTEGEFAQYLTRQLNALGLEVLTDRGGDSYGSTGYNVFARLPGELELEPVLLTAHMDTVSPGRNVRPILTDGLIHTDGSTILGGDDKSGICAILEAVRTVIAHRLPHRSAEILFTFGEEGGMRGAKSFDKSLIKSRQAFVFDSNNDVGEIITAAPGQYKIHATVTGRRAHAGLSPEAGISAIQVMSCAISKMKLLRIDDETTCNIGTFRSEFPTNIVPEQAEIIAEARSRDEGKLKNTERAIYACLQDACDSFGASLKYDAAVNYSAFSLDDNCETVATAKRALQSIGCEATLAKGNGGSDANIFNAFGIKAVALATGMSNVHTVNESIREEQLYRSARLALSLLITG